MSIEIIPTGATLGAEVRDVDLALSIDDETFAAIERAYNDHAVIFLRDQHVTPLQQVAFGSLTSGQRRTGSSSGAMRTSMLRATPGCRRISPARSRVSTIWWTEGGLTPSTAADQLPREAGRAREYKHR